VRDARVRLGSDKIVGVSVQTVEQAVSAEQGGADYLGVGAVFATSTKKDANCLPLGRLKAICESVSIPVCAIGGITKSNIRKLKGSGIDGVALISALFAQPDIPAATQEMLTLVRDVVEA
jgi:thiamine-phosphate pyrophosphorylase